MDIFEAARGGNVEAVKAHLARKPDLGMLNAYGFTALHCAASGSNSQEKAPNLEILRLLVEAGSPLELQGGGGRTALYLLAEFTPYLEAVQYLVYAGANPDVYDAHGNHVVVNAMMPEVQEYLSNLTGVAIPPPPPPRPVRLRMSAAAWKLAKADLDYVFAELAAKGLIVKQNAGTTQDDGFSDCVETWHQRQDRDSILGFCFYTGQDLARAKQSSELVLAFWGAPEGGAKEMISVGKLIVEVFQKEGFEVIWSGSGSQRPSVYLHRYSQ